LSLVLVAGLALTVGAMPLGAIPQSFRTSNGNFFGPVIPATPRFNADLTQEFLLGSTWETNAFSGDWEAEPALEGQEIVRMTANPVLFGAVPQSVKAYRENGETRELAITYLDAGAFFGFKLGGEKSHEDRMAGNAARAEFSQHYNRLAQDLRERLETGCGHGELMSVGRSNALRSTYTDYYWEDFTLRLSARPSHSLTLYITKDVELENHFLDPALVDLTSSDRSQLLAENVTSNERGDLLIENIPMFSQGYTPFCSVHSLAMTGHYFGLRMKTTGLVASAEFANTGSARGSNVMELYEATAEEVGLDLDLSSRFDARQVQRSLEAGRPVIVWRRVTEEREKAHDQFTEKLARDPYASLPEPSKAQQASWPERDKKGSPSHASVVNGINLERNEVIFTEPWGDHARNRRMRLEEMEATAYAVFYFEF